jgi:hypothetical protein
MRFRKSLSFRGVRRYDRIGFFRGVGFFRGAQCKFS